MAGIMALVVLAIVLRLASIVFVPSLNWADEIFQATEQAHRLVYSYGACTLGVSARCPVLAITRLYRAG